MNQVIHVYHLIQCSHFYYIDIQSAPAPSQATTTCGCMSSSSLANRAAEAQASPTSHP
jgi:hypothetical protein